MTIWIGIDPGSRFTGIIARSGTDLINWRVLDRKTIDPTTDRPCLAYFEAVIEAIGEVADPATASIAVEDVVEPTPHLGLTNVVAILRTAEVLGYIQCAFPHAVRVRPAGHGKNTLVSYPQALVSKSEAQAADRAKTWMQPAKDGSTLRHARAAWDVAGGGLRAARIARALTN